MYHVLLFPVSPALDIGLSTKVLKIYLLDGWMDGWMDDGWMDGQMDGWMDGYNFLTISGYQLWMFLLFQALY